MSVSVLQLAYEEQLLDRRYWKELQSNSRELLSVKSAYENVVKGKELAEAEVAKVKAVAAADCAKLKEETGRLIREAEEKAKAAVASETARLHLEFDRRWEARARKEREVAVMAYRRERGRAVEQATAYIDGGKYILGKIKEAFPSQDWSVLPEPALTEDLIDDEHKAILEEIDEEAAGDPKAKQQQRK